ncbi:MAG TPA: DUF3823 domain-containing protein [Pseudosphingobacterium sp.]|nr:DUF3823 domain-containing protein [Pseudosphingobacterium sp.]
MKKRIINIGIITALFVALAACGKDNYEAPEAKLTGRVVYNGQAIGVRGSNQSVYLQLWQDGYALKTPINLYVTQDGSFAATLFDGDYKMVTVNGNGPWASSQDTVFVQVKGNTVADYTVKPYYTISNISYTLTEGVLKASFDVTAVDPSREIEYISLMINDTRFVDFGQKMSSVELSEVSPGRVELELNVGDQLNNTKSLFARVGLKINGITEGVYDTNVEQLK